jgi:serine/threonine protein kinase
VLATGYIHEHGIVHGDISPNNIMFHGDTPVLIDFGASEIVQERRVSRISIGTAEFAAPERYRKRSTTSVDIYSLAATFCYVIEGDKSMQMVGGLWRTAPASLRSLIRAMMCPNPEQRPTAFRCLTHEFFRQTISREIWDHELSVAGDWMSEQMLNP